MNQPLALPQDIAQEKQRRAMIQAQAQAVIEGLACGIFEELAVTHQQNRMIRHDLEWQQRFSVELEQHADFAVKAALVMAEKLGYRRTPAATQV